mgnify:CR=1 FL=1
MFSTLTRMRSVLPRFAAMVCAFWLSACSQPAAAPQSTFLLLDGQTLTTQALKGKVVLVNFWATTCTSCVAEMPELSATYKQFAERGFETIAVAMSYDRPAYVARFAQTRQLPFKVAYDQSGTLAKTWDDVRLTPTSFLLNTEGQIVKRYVGAPDFKALHQLITNLLPKVAG